MSARGDESPSRTLHASTDRLLRLYRDGHLRREALEDGMRELGAARRWSWWIEHVLLVLGVGLVLAGVIFFVAFHWRDFDKSVKLGGLAFLVVATALAALRRGLDDFVGRVLLFVACVGVGIFLAAFGQVYQTGADAWEFFRAWALWITLWVIASRAHEHWLLLLGIVDVAYLRYVDQVLMLRLERGDVWPWLVLAVLHALALVGLHFGNARGYFRPARAWPRWILVPAVCFCLVAPLSMVLFRDSYARLDSWGVIVLFVGGVAGGYRYFRYVVRDLFALTCTGFATAWVLTVVLLRILRIERSGDMASFLVVGLFVVFVLTGLVKWLRVVHAEMKEGEDG